MAGVAQGLHRHRGAEGAGDALAVQQRHRDPDRRGDHGPLCHGTEHVAQDSRVLPSLALGSPPLLRQHGDVVVQHKAQQEQDEGGHQEDAQPVGQVVVWQAGAVEVKG